MDGTGRSVSVLDIYRADYADGGSVGHGYLDDAMRQVEADGWGKVGTDDGRWDWRRVERRTV